MLDGNRRPVKKSIGALKRAFLFKKEKGGVGNTGTAATFHYHLLQNNAPCIFVESNISQQDIKLPYSKNHTVLPLDLQSGSPGLSFLNLLEQVPEGSCVLVNFPGNSIEAIDEIHSYLKLAQEDPELGIETKIIWTMGLDNASLLTLQAILDGDLPGPVLLNLPEWAGPPETFTNVDEKLRQRIEDTGGTAFSCPALKRPLYDLFRKDNIGLDRILAQPNLPLGSKIAFQGWAKRRRQCDRRADLMGDGSSKMAKLYEATFDIPPSKSTSTAMLRMEQLAGLQEDEWLAKVIVIQLRIADTMMGLCNHSQVTQAKHLQSQKESMEKFQHAVYDWANLKSALEKSANDWSKAPRPFRQYGTRSSVRERLSSSGLPSQCILSCEPRS